MRPSARQRGIRRWVMEGPPSRAHVPRGVAARQERRAAGRVPAFFPAVVPRTPIGLGGAGAAVLGLLLVLLRTRVGARPPRALGVIAAATTGAIEQVLAFAAGGGLQGAESPINLGTTFAMLGVAVLIPWSPVWSAFACMLVVGEYVGTAIGTGRAAGLLFSDKLTLFVAAGIVAVVITAVLERRRWREFLRTWALAAVHREAREREKR